MNKALLIIGMHRSGTSALAGALSILGVDVGADLLPAKDDENEKGFFELKEVHSFHERLLLSGGRTWDTPWPLTSSWLERFTTPSCRAQLTEILERNFTESELWAVKDPRLCQLLPLWREILADLAVDVAVIHIVRDPAAVAASLARRNGFPTDKSGVLWLDHNLAAERDSRGLPRAFLTYEDLIEGKAGALERLAGQLGVEWPRSGGRVAEEINGFLSVDLDHSQDRAAGQNRQFGRWTDAVTRLQQLFGDLAETEESFDSAAEAFDSLRAQQEKLVAGFDSILVDHGTHLVVGTGGLRDLQQAIDSAEEALDEADVYAKQVEAALKSRQTQEEQTKKFVVSLEQDLDAHRRHSAELKFYAEELESHLEEKEALNRQLDEQIAEQTLRLEQHDQALQEAARYTKVVEAEIEKYRLEKAEVAEHIQMLESQLEVHRAEQDEAARYTKTLESQLEEHRTEQEERARYSRSLESELENHRTQQEETARYIQELLSQLDRSGTEPANLASEPSPDEGAGESPVKDVKRSRLRR